LKLRCFGNTFRLTEFSATLDSFPLSFGRHKVSGTPLRPGVCALRVGGMPVRDDAADVTEGGDRLSVDVLLALTAKPASAQSDD